MKTLAEMFADDIVRGGVAAAAVTEWPYPAVLFRAWQVSEVLQAAGYADAAIIDQDPYDVPAPKRYHRLRDIVVEAAAGKRVVVFDYSQGQRQRWMSDIRVVTLITDDSLEKVQRRLAAAQVVEERLQEEANQFQTWTYQPPGLGVPGEILLSGLTDAGIKYGGFVLTKIEPWETAAALIRERVYPMDDIQAGGAFNYGASISPLMKDKSRPVVVIGRALGASMFVAVSTWDSPEKVARKLMAALSVRESKLTEGWQVMPHRPSLTKQSTEEWYDLELRLKRAGLRSVGYVRVADYAALVIYYRRQLIEVYGQENVQEVSGPFRLNIRPDHAGKGGIVVYAWVTAGSRILVVTDDSPEKLARKMVARGADKSDLEESWTAPYKPNSHRRGEVEEFDLVARQLKEAGVASVGYTKSDTCTLGVLLEIAADEFGVENIAVIPDDSPRARTTQLLADVKGKRAVVAVSKAGWCVAIITNDSPEKVARRLTRRENEEKSMINEDRGGPLVISQEFPEESPMYRIAENMERHGTKINGIISNFWGSAAYNAALRAGYEASWTMSFKNSDGALDINGRLVEQCVLVLGSLVTSTIAVCVHTSDSPEKVRRKLEAARFNTESLSRTPTDPGGYRMSKARQLIEAGESRVIPGYDPLSLNHHLITDAVINALQHLRNVKATVEFGETAYQGNYTQLLLLASQAYGFDVADMAVAFNRIHKEFVKLAAGKHVWAINRTGTAVRSGYVFIITDDSFDKVERKLAAADAGSMDESVLVEAAQDWTDWGSPPPDTGQAAMRFRSRIARVAPGTKMLFATTGVADWAARLPFVQALAALYPGRVLDSEYSFGVAQLDFLEGMLKKFEPKQVVFLFMDKFAYDTTVVVTDDSLEKIHRKVEAYQSKLESIQPVTEDIDGWKTVADGWVQFYNHVRPFLPSGTWRAIETAVIAAMGGKHDKSSLSTKENPEAHLVFVRCGSQLFDFINTTRYAATSVVVSDQDVTTNWLRNLFDLNVSKLPAGTAKYVYAFMTSSALRTVKIVFTDDPPDKVQRTIMAAKTVREGNRHAEPVVEGTSTWKTSARGWSDFYKRVAPVISKEAAMTVKQAVYAAGGGDVESEPPETFNPKSRLEFIRTGEFAHKEFASLLATKYKDSTIFLAYNDVTALDAAPEYSYSRTIARRLAAGVAGAGGTTRYTYVIMLHGALYAMTVVFTNDSPDKFRRTVAAAEVVAEALSR